MLHSPSQENPINMTTFKSSQAVVIMTFKQISMELNYTYYAYLVLGKADAFPTNRNLMHETV